MESRILVLALAVVLAWPAPGRAENVLRWSSAISGLTFDPHAFNHYPTRAQNLQVYEPLVDFDSDHTIRPGLAVAWRPVDSTTWEFELRQGVRFHDGTPLAAEDVVFSLNRGLSPKSEFARDVPPVAAVEAESSRIVRIRSVEPNPILPEQLFSIGIMSKVWRSDMARSSCALYRCRNSLRRGPRQWDRPLCAGGIRARHAHRPGQEFRMVGVGRECAQHRPGRDRLELPVDALDFPRFRLARFKSPDARSSP